jgi:hypothetical protein
MPKRLNRRRIMKRFTNIVENIPEDREIAEFVSPHPQIHTVFVGAAKERFDRENADGKLAERIKAYVDNFRAQIGALKDYGSGESSVEDRR